MRCLLSLIAALLAAAATALPASSQGMPDSAAAETRPVLVELFTSQGCGLCPDANRYLGVLDQRDNVFVLAFGVSYWDMYGWADTYARPEYVQRQRMYLPRLGVTRLYTPHFVVDGVTDAPGWNQNRVAMAVDDRLAAMPDSPSIELEDGPFGSFMVRLDGEAPEDSLDIWLIAYAPGWATVDIAAGENRGIEMPQYNMVKSLTYLGRWSGGPAAFMGEAFRHYGTVAIVQGANGGPIYGYAQASPESNRRH